MNLGVSSVCITNKVPLRMVKKYVFICSKRAWEAFVYMHETYVHHADEGDFTLQEEATTSIQHSAKRKKKHKHKRKRDGELYAFFP